MSINGQDLHILKYCSAFVSVTEGRVFYITEPKAGFCPLARYLYRDMLLRGSDKDSIREGIKRVVEFKIKKYGFFTPGRRFDLCDAQIPYGASEIMMFALREKALDAAVIVCDGAGTVICSSPEILQGIGGRMHNIILTSPVQEIIKKLEFFGCRILSKNALIDQVAGVLKAIKMGYKKIGVTIDGHGVSDLRRLRNMEEEYGVEIVIMVICTTGLTRNFFDKAKKEADFIWSCFSAEARRVVAPAAKQQLSKAMPVYVMTDLGGNLVSAISKHLRKPKLSGTRLEMKGVRL